MEDSLLGQILLNFKLVTPDSLKHAVERQQRENPPRLLGDILVNEGVLDEKSLRSILSVQKRSIEPGKAHPVTPEPELRRRLKGAPASEYLRFAREVCASDLYISSGLKPMIRLHGNLADLPLEPLTLDEARALIFPLLTPAQIKQYGERKSVDAALHPAEGGRFRANVFRHLGGIAAIFRVITDEVIPLERLGLPAIVRRFTEFSRGLVLVTGPAGSGKSTTLAALLDHINRTQRLHIVTIEDPIEIVLKSDKSLVSQRQVPEHSKTFAGALRSALREDPDVLVVGELRDPESTATAVTAAETGHLVFGTLHTHNAHQTVARLLDQFPGGKRTHIRMLVAAVLRGIVSQQLIPNLDGRGRSLASEVMVANPAIANLIREDRSWQIPLVMQTGRKQGMQLMDDSLLDLVQQKKISLEEALSRATDRSRMMHP